MTTAPAPTAVSTWAIDPVHSIAEFAVKHLVVATVKGRFRDLEGVIEIDEAQLENSKVSAAIDVASVDTGVPDRDADLRSDNFFSAEAYPKMTFRSTRVERIDDTHGKVYGDLTIRDVTKGVVLDTEYAGQVDDPWGGRRAGFTAITKISRGEFGVRWNQLIETGGVAVGDNVKVTLHIEAVQQK